MRIPRRRPVLAAAAAGAALVVAIGAAWLPGPAALPAGSVTLLYVGAEDCAPCRNWKRGDGAAFRASALFAKLAYREVNAPELHDLMADANWPADLRRYRTRLAIGTPVPAWLIIVAGEVAMQEAGPRRWRRAVLPRLESSLRRRDLAARGDGQARRAIVSRDVGRGPQRAARPGGTGAPVLRAVAAAGRHAGGRRRLGGDARTPGRPDGGAIR